MSDFTRYDDGNQFTIDTSSDIDQNLLESVEKVLANRATSITRVENLTDFLAGKADYDIIDYSKIYIAGISLEQTTHYKFCENTNAESNTIPMTAMRYNPVPYHSRPLATNLLSNFLFNVRGGTGDIVMTSHPLIFTTELTSTGIQKSDINVPAMQYMVIMSIAMALLL